MVTPLGVLDDGVLLVQDATIVWVGPADDVPSAWSGHVPPREADPLMVLPGLVDVHCHGGGGASFPDALDVEQAWVGAREHLAHGTTSLVASLVTAPPEVLLERTAVLAELADAGELAGIHLEGPFLSADRCGAQNPADMQRGSAQLVARVAAVARGHLVTMTIAPEVPGVADGASSAGEGSRTTWSRPSWRPVRCPRWATPTPRASRWRRRSHGHAGCCRPMLRRVRRARRPRTCSTACARGTTAIRARSRRAWRPRRVVSWSWSWSPTAPTWPTGRCVRSSTWWAPTRSRW
ncbi:amidohydrolase family protein [Cellulomonas soli]